MNNHGNSILSDEFGPSRNIADGSTRRTSIIASANHRIGQQVAVLPAWRGKRQERFGLSAGTAANRYLPDEAPRRKGIAGRYLKDILVATALTGAVVTIGPVAVMLRFTVRKGLPLGARFIEAAERKAVEGINGTLDLLTPEHVAPTSLAANSAFCAAVALVMMVCGRSERADALPATFDACMSAPLSEYDQCQRDAIAHFLETKTKERNPLKMADILVRTTRHPIELAAIEKMETNGVPGLVGSSGELSKFQLMHFNRPRHFNANDDEQAAKAADNVLHRGIKRSHGSAWHGIRRYNGGGKKALAYATRAWVYRQLIKKDVKRRVMLAKLGQARTSIS